MVPNTSGTLIASADLTAFSSPPTDLLMAESLVPDESSFITESTIDPLHVPQLPTSVSLCQNVLWDVPIFLSQYLRMNYRI